MKTKSFVLSLSLLSLQKENITCIDKIAFLFVSVEVSRIFILQNMMVRMNSFLLYIALCMLTKYCVHTHTLEQKKVILSV